MSLSTVLDRGVRLARRTTWGHVPAKHRHVVKCGVQRLLWPGGRSAVLLYHRIGSEPPDPYAIQVSPRHFEEHLAVIRSVATPIRLRDLVRAVRAGRVPERAVAVAFDDGYADNLEVAVPLLERYDVPATVFCMTGSGGRDREFWSDSLERVFLTPGTLPAHLALQIGPDRYAWEFGASATWSAADAGQSARWSAFDDPCSTPRHQALRTLWTAIGPLPVAEQRETMAVLEAWAGLEHVPPRPSRRLMTPAQVGTLAAGGLVDVEAHTVNHPVLSVLPPEAQRREMLGSARDVEAWTGRPVEGFSYPYGAHGTCSVAAARAVGFAYACSLGTRSVWSRSDPYLLPRLSVRDEAGEQLAETLAWHFR